MCPQRRRKKFQLILRSHCFLVRILPLLSRTQMWLLEIFKFTFSIQTSTLNFFYPQSSIFCEWKLIHSYSFMTPIIINSECQSRNVIHFEIYFDLNSWFLFSNNVCSYLWRDHEKLSGTLTFRFFTCYYSFFCFFCYWFRLVIVFGYWWFLVDN